MQDRYAGDIGDFGKFGLLRTLRSSLHSSLGVVWYRYRNEAHNEDGKFTRYLSAECSKFRPCDPDLWSHLKSLVDSDRRSVAAIQQSRVLGDDTLFFDRFTDCYTEYPGQTKSAKERRTAYRERWLDDAITTVRDSRLVFLDPDNGLEVKSCAKAHQRRAGKFAFYTEATRFFSDADVLVVYHHLNRHKNHGTHTNQLQSRSKELKSKTGCDGAVFGLRYPPFSARAFFVACRSPLVTHVQSTLDTFLKSEWGEFWDPEIVKI